MNSVLKFDQSNVNIRMAETTIAHRYRYNKKVKHEDTTGPREEEAINTTAIEPERPGARKVLRMAKVHTVDTIQTKEALDVPGARSLTSMSRSTIQNLYSPSLLGSNAPEFNTATRKGFRTQQERRHLAFIKTLERKHKDTFHGEEKGLSSSVAVLDISKPAKLHSRYVIAHPKTAT